MTNLWDKLRNAPRGFKLYTPICGEVELLSADYRIIYTRGCNGERLSFDEYGRYINSGECLLFPSKEVRDWNNFHPYFEWKKGDVLKRTNDGVTTIFDEFVDDKMTQFKSRHRRCINGAYLNIDNMIDNTADYSKVDDAEAAEYISHVEKICDGKLNMETLETEKPQRYFEVRQFKPFDKVVVRDDYDDKWTVNFFSYKLFSDDGYGNIQTLYYCVDASYCQILPYNEETAKLIGTTDNYEE